MRHYVLVYLINSGTRNFFATTIFGIRHFFVGWTGSYKSTPSIAMILAFSVAILSWSMPSDDLVLWDLLANAFTITGVGVNVVACTDAGLCWGSWPCSPILSLGWAVVGIWTKVMGWLEGPSLEAFFLSVCSSKLVRRVHLPSETPTFLGNEHYGKHALHLPFSHLESGVVDSFVTYIST